MTAQFTCPECGSGIHVLPSQEAEACECDICHHRLPLTFLPEHEQGELRTCPCCQRKDFYQQKDFNRKVGVALFCLAALLSIWTYGTSLIVLYLADLFLFKKLGNVVVCYKCQAVFRKVKNLVEIRPYDHEMNDRIVYAGHDFEGKALNH